VMPLSSLRIIFASLFNILFFLLTQFDATSFLLSLLWLRRQS